MKSIKFFAVALFAFVVSIQAQAATNTQGEKTAESVYEFASQMDEFNQEALTAEIRQLSEKEMLKLAQMAVADVKVARAAGLEPENPAYYILAIFIPPVAVGLHTDWGMPTVWNVVWCLFGYLPGIVHAFIVLGR
ncbi:MAG: YqaE/Pmp3 family membrane protein [Bacteroidota bacterium]